MADVKGSRRAKAQATRARILEAAREEFLEHGFHGARVSSIAARAGVATQTVYFVFHSKPELISAVIDAAVLGGDPTPPEQTNWWLAMEAEPDGAEALRLFVRGAAPLFARAAGISEVLRAAALTDDEVRATHEHHEQLRREAFGQVIAILAAKTPLRHDLDPQRATDVLFTVFGDTVWHQLTSELGWSDAQVVEWLCESLPAILLGPPNASARAAGRQPRTPR